MKGLGSTRYLMEDKNRPAFEQARLLYLSTSKDEGDWRSIRHSHPCSELFYVVSGSGIFAAEKEEFPVTKDDMVVINPYVEHTERSGSASPLEYIVLGIEGLSFFLEDTASVREGVCVRTSSGAVYKYNMQRADVYPCLDIMLREIACRKDHHEAVCQCLLEVLLICLLRSSHLTAAEERNHILNRECAQIKHYLDANYSENITLDFLAGITHMNKYYMVHAFTKYTGLSPINYLIRKRVKEGKALLASTSYSIAQISTQLGFSSQSYFSQVFKKATGETPVQYRKNSGQAEQGGKERFKNE